MNIYTIENDKLKVILTDYAASVYQIYLKKDNELKAVLSTPKNITDFIDMQGSYGRTVGRTAGRLFKYNESMKYVDFKDEASLMHGGTNKFAAKYFTLDNMSDTSISFSLNVNSYEDQYTGNLSAKVTYSLEDTSLVVKHEALADEDSLLNMTFHPYFNLDQTENLSSHELVINAEYYLSQNEIGRFVEKVSVENTYRDYRNKKQLVINENNKLDGIFMFNDNYACTLSTKEIKMNVFSNYDSLVVYTQNKGASHDLTNALANTLHAGIAIECQKPQSILPIIKANEPYNYYIKYEFDF
ncbi:hypothetical protein [Acholeplasma hippikon]|uniref:Aldose 1-epimerase n=1 Tax=Acholeplasma hippikon TaxID=264636 RepID=A0A449BLG9_9MOLU|nr:hypothetical protein [Acholeplasma hippikon]VEU83272.1 Aldose 1-epimerase [Acholeplasma hippikon]